MRKFFSNTIKIVAATLGLSFFGTEANSAASSTNPALVLNCKPEVGLSRKEEIQCACDVALRKGTIEALESFLHLYSNEDSACSALASTALVKFGNNDKNGSPGGGLTPGGGIPGYGQ